MQTLLKEIKKLENSSLNEKVEKRLKEFSSFSSKSNEEWFSELCFCILAANSKQKTAENIEKSLKYEKLLTLSQEELANFIRNNKHRFHNNKAKFIVEARKYFNIKDKINEIIKQKGYEEARLWLVQNVKGIGYKEASHFLRNTGFFDLAILDRHILNTMIENNIIERPKTLTRNNYLEIEKIFFNLAKKLEMPPAKLDLFMWYMKTGEVLK